MKRQNEEENICIHINFMNLAIDWKKDWCIINANEWQAKKTKKHEVANLFFISFLTKQKYVLLKMKYFEGWKNF